MNADLTRNLLPGFLLHLFIIVIATMKEMLGTCDSVSPFVCLSDDIIQQNIDFLMMYF